LILEATNLYKEEVIAGFRCKFFDEVNSTNDFAKETIEELASYLPAVVVASYQREGKGQEEKIWVSDKDKNLLFSVIIKPGFSLPEAIFRINYILTFSLIKTLEEKFSMPAKLKWPNDIYLNDRKIAGILVENSIAGDKINTVIGGIGLNINQEFDKITDFKAISMRDFSGKDYQTAAVLQEFLKMLKEISEKSAFTSLNFLEEKISKLLWNRGREQRFLEKDTNKLITASPDKFCSDHRLLVKHNGINKKLTYENYQWMP
jgi:BirA family biotin operon repressor/biotin-[acetyl-CoA-carboxylase] ligase